ncbi:Uncharacterized protein Fot_10326 [Forsythia ovata]|uniref:Uncharacterized protein n=1 Tax=Forsythia ovata TaxID=205694 RepID=A0ABD1WGY1_9LAMI
MVKVTSAKYKEKSGEVQWTISGRTRIHRVEENNSSLLISTNSFTDFKDFPKYMDSNIDISLSLSTKADSSFFIDGEFEIVQEFKSWGHTNSEMIDEIVCEKYYLSLTPSKLSSKLSVPTDEKDFTEIKSIQGLKTVVVAELINKLGNQQPNLVVAEEHLDRFERRFSQNDLA